MSDQTNKNNNRYNPGQIIKSEMDSQSSSHQPNVPSATITSASGNNNTASLLPPPPRLITYYNHNLGNPRDNSSSRIRYTSRFPVSHTVVSSNLESSNPVGFIQNQSAVDSGGGPEEYEDDEDEEIEVVETIPALITGSGIITLATDSSIFEHDFSNRDSPISSALPNNNSTHFLGRLMSRENVLFMGEELVDIGRNSSRSTVTFHVGKNIFVSRKHMQLFFYQNEFYLTCLSKNGIFIDGVFTRQTQHPIRLPRSCNFRFPSTNIRVGFENLAAPNDSNDSSGIFQNTPTTSSCSPIIPSSPVITTSPVTPSVHSSPFINVEKSSPSSASTSEELPNVMYAPITVAVGEDRRTPFPSPTGTISAANSCPPSPHNRPIFTEFTNYSTPSASTTTFTANDIFLPPASSSYGEHEKPPYSYAQLIVQSISSSPEKQLTLSGIYSFISKNYPYYRTGANKGWQNSIRHNLSLNRYFIKVPRSQDEPGKGSFWRIDPTSEYKLIDQSFRKRRQRGTQFPFGMPRSAPVSPSHIDLLLHFVDNSTENSPLHDITMQSAPGSPGNYHNNHSDPQSIDGGTLAVREPLIRMYPTTYIVSPNANCTTVKRERNDDSDDSPSNTREHTEYDKYDTLKRPKYSDN